MAELDGDAVDQMLRKQEERGAPLLRCEAGLERGLPLELLLRSLAVPGAGPAASDDENDVRS